MQATIWGCRGSLATPGPSTVRYGGNTSCVQLQPSDGEVIVLDAGTGIRELGMDPAVQAARKITLLLTHLHMDHLEGLGFFGPLWNPDVEIDVYGPPSPMHTLGQRIERYLSPPLFPVHLDDVPARLRFFDATDASFDAGSAHVTAQPIAHAGPAVGYRIEDGEHSLAYLPDHEPSHGVSLSELDPTWISGYDLAAGVDFLLHDSQYTEDEYPDKVGWGHSSVEHVVTFARLAGVRQLIMFHHDPLHDDAFLERHLGRARELWGSAGRPPVLAHEGMRIDLPARALV